MIEKEKPIFDLESEKKEILRRYRSLLRAFKIPLTKTDKNFIRKAFDVALEAHKETRRKSGEPYIYHPIAVARIVVEEMGLDVTSVVAALLHDTVEDTYITLQDIENLFGKKERFLIDGLTKVSGVFDQSTSDQAENFRKMLLTLTDDVRVILIKIADRLHNMRTLGSMPKQKQLKIASETQYMYAPLSHRLGLYSIKTELEDLSLKYKESEEYQNIYEKLQRTKGVRTRFINQFSEPIKEALQKENLKFELKARTKSIYSIWNKIKKQNISFEEVYDLFAIRIILDSKPKNEKADCWKVYSIVTDFYKPNTERLRDWISNPKANGYESLHATVMSDGGKWVEVQIRTKRMNEVAEKGLAAHWSYKGGGKVSAIDKWLSQIRELLENPEANALDFIDDFKLNLFADEIYVFTPSGDLKKLPKGATSLDFAFEIHTQVGAKCMGAKVNNRLVPLSHILKSGDQVEILTSKNQKPKEDWLNFVITGKAKAKIKSSLKEEMKSIANDGREILQRKFKNWKIDFKSVNISLLEKFYGISSATELYYLIAKNKIDLRKIKQLTVDNGTLKIEEQGARKPKEKKESQSTSKSKSDTLVLNDNNTKLDYKLAACCNPIAGDDVFAFVTVNDGIKIHRTKCPNATQLLGSYNYRVLKAQWESQKEQEFLANLTFKGIDDMGLVQKITNTISQELHINMKSISFESDDGIFYGKIGVFVHDTKHLNGLIKKLKQIDGVRTVKRVEGL